MLTSWVTRALLRLWLTVSHTYLKIHKGKLHPLCILRSVNVFNDIHTEMCHILNLLIFIDTLHLFPCAPYTPCLSWSISINYWIIVGLCWWFGILRVPLSNKPFPFSGIPGIQTNKSTMSWLQDITRNNSHTWSYPLQARLIRNHWWTGLVKRVPVWVM